MQKGQTSKKVSSLVLGSSMFLMSLLPAASAFAATAPTLSMTGPSNISVSPGGSATFTVSGSGLASNEEYQFWIETPSGKWQVAQNYSSNNSFTINNAQTGNYLVEAYAMTPAQIQAGDWSAAVASNNGESAGIFVGSTVTTKVVVSGTNTAPTDVAPGTQLTATATASGVYDPMYQFWVQYPDGSWHQSGAYTNSNTYTFVAPTAGAYKVVSYAKSPLGLSDPAAALMSNKAQPVAFGTASAVTLSPSSSSLVADGQATDNVTAKVVDSNGNTVANYNGPVSAYVNSSDSGVSLMKNGVAASSSLAQPVTYMAKNGVVTIPVQSGTTSGSSATVYAQVAGGSWKSTTLTETTPVATSMKFSNTTTLLNSQVMNETSLNGGYVSSGGNANAGAVEPTVTFLDQAGNPIPLSDLVANPGMSLTVSGVGVDANLVNYDGVSGSEQVYASTSRATGSLATNIPLYNQGSFDSVEVVAQNSSTTGSVTVSANDPSLADPNASMNLTAYQQGGYHALAVNNTSTSTSFSADTVGNSSANEPSFKVSAVDMNGMWTTGTSSSADPTNVYVSVLGPNGKTTSAFGVNSTTASTSPVAVSMSNGVASFSVLHATSASIPAGTYTVKVADSASNPTSVVTKTFTVTAGTIAQFAIKPASSAPTVNLLASNPVSTVSVQLQDQYGNPISQSGVILDVATGAYATTPNKEVMTNSSGQAVIPISLPTNALSDTGSLTVTLNNTWAGNNGSSVNSSDLSSLTASGGTSATFKESSTIASSLSAKASQSSYTAGGTNPSVTAYALDSNGAPEPDALSYTVTSPNGTTSSAATATAGTAFNPLGSNSNYVAGTYTVTITDTQAVGNPKTTVSFNITPAAVSGAALFINGTNTLKDTTDYTAANTQTPVKVALVDQYGNITSSNASATVSLATSDGGIFTQNGSIVTSVTIPAGSNGVTVDYSNTNAVPYGDLTASYTPPSAAFTLQTASLNTSSTSSTSNPYPQQLVLAYSGNVSGTTSATPDASQYSVSVNGANDAVTSATTSGSDVILTLAAVPTLGQTVTVSYTSDSTNPVVGSNGTDVASFSNQDVSLK